MEKASEVETAWCKRSSIFSCNSLHFTSNRKTFSIGDMPKWNISIPLPYQNGTLQRSLILKESKFLPAPMAHRAATISASVALSHTSANAVKATERRASPLVAQRVKLPTPFSYVERQTRRQ